MNKLNAIKKDQEFCGHLYLLERKYKNEKRNKIFLDGVFEFGHPSMYEPQRTGLNFLEQATHSAIPGL